MPPLNEMAGPEPTTANNDDNHLKQIWRSASGLNLIKFPFNKTSDAQDTKQNLL